MKNGIKGLVMLALAYFFFSRITNGTLFFYINNRFAWLTFLAVIGFVLISIGYLQRAAPVQAMLPGAAGADDRDHDHDHDHHHDHDHTLTRVGLFLVLLPVILGTFIPAKPLGAVAASNREINVGRLSSALAPSNSQIASSAQAKNLLDWLMAFDREPNPATFSGQQADLVGFVYRDSRFAEDTFMLSRFIVSCCVADATPIGLIVRWPDAPTLADDQWVQVTGRFEPGEFAGQSMPVLVAEELQPTDMPNQPYLFP